MIWDFGMGQTMNDAQKALRPVKALIFDLDGTLVNTIYDLTRSVNAALAAIGRPPLPVETARSYVGDGVRELISRAVGTDDAVVDKAFAVFSGHYREHNGEKAELYEGVEQLLTGFKSKKMAVLTNKPQRYVGPLLDYLQIKHYFNIFQGAVEGVPLKPEPAALLTVLNRLDVSPEQAVMIGDSDHDIHAGKAAGTFTAAVTYGYRPREMLRACAPDVLLDRISDLTGYFR